MKPLAVLKRALDITGGGDMECRVQDGCYWTDRIFLSLLLILIIDIEAGGGKLLKI